MGFTSFNGPAAGSQTLTTTGSVALGVTLFQKAEDSPSANADIGIPIWEVRRDAMTGSSATSDGDYATKNQDADGFSYTRDKAFDSQLQATRIIPMVQQNSNRVTQPIALIAAAQNYSTPGAWADLGPEILVDGYNKVLLWISHVNNNNTGTIFRALAKHTNAGTDEYSLPIITTSTSLPLSASIGMVGDSYFKLIVDTTQKVVIPFEVFNSIPYIQFQCQAVLTGSAGQAGGNVATAYVTMATG